MDRPLFVYDLGSPYAYLAAERVDALFSGGVDWVPVLLGGIFRATGRSSWAQTDARAAGMAEVERRAAAYGLPAVRWPSRWPNDGLRVMRVAAHAHELGEGRRFALEAFRVQFAEGRPLDDEQSIAAACARAGLDPAAALAASTEPDVKARLRDNTDHALEQGVTGVPAVIAGGRVYWGDDRLEEAARA